VLCSVWRGRRPKLVQGQACEVLGLRGAVVNVWSATNVIRLVAGHQRQRRKDVRVGVLNAVLIDRMCTLAGDGLRLSEH
jgi:hypothetical protein